MRLREHEGIKEGKLDMLRADPRHLIVQDGYNVRDLTTPDAVEKLRELSASIAELGVTDPFVVRFDGERIIVVEGHRRLAATMMAIEAGTDIKSVPIYQQAARVNDADRDLGLIISNSGEPLTQLEKAKVVGRLVAHGWTHDEIRKKCGWKSNATVTGYLDMLAMPAELQKAVKNGEVSATVARRLEAEQPGLAAKIIADAAEEQKRLGKKHRATPKAIKKATGKEGKLPIPERAPRQSETTTEQKDETQTPPVVATPAQQLPGIPQDRNDAANGPAGRDHDNVPVAAPPRQAIADLIEALAPWAHLMEGFDLTERDDDETVDVRVRIGDVKHAFATYVRAKGGVS